MAEIAVINGTVNSQYVFICSVSSFRLWLRNDFNTDVFMAGKIFNKPGETSNIRLKRGNTDTSRLHYTIGNTYIAVGYTDLEDPEPAAIGKVTVSGENHWENLLVLSTIPRGSKVLDEEYATKHYDFEDTLNS